MTDQEDRVFGASGVAADVQAALVEVESRREDICEYAGHEYVDAGGGMLICEVCTDEKWADE